MKGIILVLVKNVYIIFTLIITGEKLITKNKQQTIFDNNIRHVYWASNQQIIMISEASCAGVKMLKIHLMVFTVFLIK